MINIQRENDVPEAIAQILDICAEKGWRPDRALFNGWLRFYFSQDFDKRDDRFHSQMWKLKDTVDKDLE